MSENLTDREDVWTRTWTRTSVRDSHNEDPVGSRGQAWQQLPTRASRLFLTHKLDFAL